MVDIVFLLMSEALQEHLSFSHSTYFCLFNLVYLIISKEAPSFLSSSLFHLCLERRSALYIEEKEVLTL